MSDQAVKTSQWIWMRRNNVNWGPKQGRWYQCCHYLELACTEPGSAEHHSTIWIVHLHWSVLLVEMVDGGSRQGGGDSETPQPTVQPL